MRISEAAARIGVAEHVLRHWDEVGAVRPDRTAARCAVGSLRCSELEGPPGTRDATLCSNNRAESVVEARCAHALKLLRCSAVLKGAYPTAGASRLAGLAVGCWLFWDSPSKPLRSAEDQGACEARFKH